MRRVVAILAGVLVGLVGLGAGQAEARKLRSFVLPEAVHPMDESDLPRAAPRPLVAARPLAPPPTLWTPERIQALHRQFERFLAEREEQAAASTAEPAWLPPMMPPPGMLLPDVRTPAYARALEHFVAERDASALEESASFALTEHAAADTPAVVQSGGDAIFPMETGMGSELRAPGTASETAAAERAAPQADGAEATAFEDGVAAVVFEPATP
jgi:hypothetical protein